MSKFEELLTVLQDPVRRRLIDLLRRGPARTHELAEHTEMSAAAVSRHLKVLRESRVVDRLDVEGDGRGRAYRLRPDALVGLKQWLSDQHWADRLAETDDTPAVAVMQRRAGEFLDAFATGDVAFFEEHLAEDVSIIFPGMDGKLAKVDVIAQVREHPPYTEWKVLGTSSIQMLGGGSTLLTARTSSTTVNRTRPAEVFMTVVYTDDADGGWQLRHLQQTVTATSDSGAS